MPPIVQNPHSCNHCQRLLLKSPLKDYHKYEFDFSLADILQAAAEQCSFFQWFLDDIVESPGWKDIAEKPETNEKLKLFAYVHGFESSAAPGIEWFELSESCYTKNGFALCTPSDNVASCEVFTRPIYRDVGSDHHFSMIRNWLEECTLSHWSQPWSCPRPINSFMPTRVIEVIKGKTNWRLRLHHSASIRKPYVALSYCWGGDQVIKSMKHTIKDWTVSLPFEILPKTLQDAIIVTSKLDIRYLWVDALCIIQDDAEDMAREISQMAQIYNSAMITIAASRAKTVNEGFLEVRDAGDPPHLIFELPYQTTKGELGSVTLVNLHRSGETFRGEPLDTRAWAFQEKLLSPRLLDYRSRQLRWACRLAGNSRNTQYVDGWEGGSNNQFYGNSRNWLFNNFDPVHKKHEEHLDEWSRVVDSYSARSLTFLSDKLPALSGAADKFGCILSDTYVAGMWQNALRFNLCWYRKNRAWPPLIARPRAYQAPSWSWASINEQVTMYSPKNFHAAGSKFLIQILHCEVRLADEMVPYGAVTAGVLTVKGRMKQIERNFHNNREQWAFNAMGIKAGSDMAPTKIYLDALEDGLVPDEEDQIRVFALEMFMYCRDFPSSEMGHEGLLVCKSQANGDDAVYSRVGYFETEEKPAFQRLAAEDEEIWRSRNYECLKWFDDCEPQVLTII